MSTGSSTVPRARRSTVPESRATLLRTSSDAAETIRTSSVVRSFQGSRAAGGAARPAALEQVGERDLHVLRVGPAQQRHLAPQLVAGLVAGRHEIGVHGQAHGRDGAHRDAAALEREPEIPDRAAGHPEVAGDEGLALADLGPQPLDLAAGSDQARAALDVVEDVARGAVPAVLDADRPVPGRVRRGTGRGDDRSRGGRSARGRAWRGRAASRRRCPVTFASTAGFSAARSSVPCSRRSTPSPTACTSPTTIRPFASDTRTSPSVRTSPGRSRVSRRTSRHRRTPPTAFLPPPEGRRTWPCAASAPPSPAGSAAGVKSSRAARSRTSTPTSNASGVAERSPRAERLHRSGTASSPWKSPCDDAHGQARLHRRRDRVAVEDRVRERRRRRQVGLVERARAGELEGDAGPRRRAPRPTARRALRAECRRRPRAPRRSSRDTRSRGGPRSSRRRDRRGRRRARSAPGSGPCAR